MTFCSVPRRDYFSLRAPTGPLIPFGDMGTLSGTHFSKLIIIYFIKVSKLLEYFQNIKISPISGSKHLDSNIFSNKLKIIYHNLGSWEFVNYLARNQSCKGRGSRFFATYFGVKRG